MPQKKLPNTLYLPKQMGKKKLDDLELDESILHKGFLVELLGTSSKQNDGGDERP